MKNVIVTVERGNGNFSAFIEELPGCITTGLTVEEIDKNMREAIEGHIETLMEYKQKVPKAFRGEYELVFKYEPDALLAQYEKIFTKAALERITGINQRQLWHYSSGAKKPRVAQRERIEAGLHRLGKELLSIKM